MSSSESEEELVLRSSLEKWSASEESILIQKVTKLTKSESQFRFNQYNPSLTFSELQLREIHLKNFREKASQKWEVDEEEDRFPQMVQTRSLLRDEMEILKVNLSNQDKTIALRESQMPGEGRSGAGRRRRLRKLMKMMNGTPYFLQRFNSSKVRDLLAEIDASESAKTDKVAWKFLKRSSSIRKEAVTAKQYVLQARTLHIPVLKLLSDSSFQNSHPIKITCPNCRFYITTNVKRISTFRTKMTSFMLTFIRKMVSASSTSAKNLFVESKLRLSDRVQVNVNNIAAITRQIQRGSKANENLITAAKNLALQEAAIENSETNLKKLRLLTTHLNNQLDSLHNSSSKIEVVLEQVCSMQR